MNYILVVVRDFAQYKVGALVSDPVQIAAVEAQYGAPYVVRVPAGSNGGVPVPSNPVVGLSDTLTVIRNGVPRPVQVGDLIFAGVTRQFINDQDYSALPTDGYVGWTALTAARTLTLAPAASYPITQPFYSADESGACSPSIPIIIIAQGADTIAGQPAVSIGSPYQKLTFHSNGSNLWTVA